MAYMQAPQARARPAVVTAACWLMGLLTFLYAVGVITELLVYDGLIRGVRKAYASSGQLDAQVAVYSFIEIATVAIMVLLGIAVVILAMFNARGANPARIVTWVFGGIVLCCGLLSLVASAADGAISSFNTTSGSGSDGPDTATAARIIGDAVPGWYQPSSLVRSGLAVICWLAVVILLALPAANDYFRKPDLMWAPGFPQLPPTGPANFAVATPMPPAAPADPSGQFGQPSQSTGPSGTGIQPDPNSDPPPPSSWNSPG